MLLFSKLNCTKNDILKQVVNKASVSVYIWQKVINRKLMQSRVCIIKMTIAATKSRSRVGSIPNIHEVTERPKYDTYTIVLFFPTI